jgi:hypothetical protein
METAAEVNDLWVVEYSTKATRSVPTCRGQCYGWYSLGWSKWVDERGAVNATKARSNRQPCIGKKKTMAVGVANPHASTVVVFAIVSPFSVQ